MTQPTQQQKDKEIEEAIYFEDKFYDILKWWRQDETGDLKFTDALEI